MLTTTSQATINVVRTLLARRRSLKCSSPLPAVVAESFVKGCAATMLPWHFFLSVQAFVCHRRGPQVFRVQGWIQYRFVFSHSLDVVDAQPPRLEGATARRARCTTVVPRRRHRVAGLLVIVIFDRRVPSSIQLVRKRFRVTINSYPNASSDFEYACAFAAQPSSLHDNSYIFPSCSFCSLVLSASPAVSFFRSSEL